MSYDAKFAGYLVDYQTLLGKPRDLIFGDVLFDPGMTEIHVRAQLSVLLDCELIHIDIDNVPWFALIPPNADHINGKETKEDLEFKAKAIKWGVEKSQWFHMEKSSVRFY